MCRCVSVTEQWAQYSVAGPHSRATAAKAARSMTPIFPTSAFPYMAAGELQPRRHARRGCSASRSPANSPTRSRCRPRYGDALVRAADGRRASEFGVDALRHRGARRDADRERPRRRQRTQRPDHRARSRTRPHDVDQKGFHRPRHGGAAGAGRPEPADPGRPARRSIARSACGPARTSCRSALRRSGERRGLRDLGGFRPSLGHWIGLGLLARGPERMGEQIRVYDPVRSEDFEAEIVSPVFVDPEGVRLRG